MTQVEHPNVVRVYAWLTVHDHHYLVMQYVSGGSLADLLKSEGPLDWQRAARYVADVGEGLLEVHARGIVHRDVKPANILWDPRRDEALLTDFGVAARLADPAAVAGSIPYMAPEAFDGRVSPSLDVYSLAATFFHLVTGSQPFPSSRIADLKSEIRRGLPDPDPRCVGLPEPLERIIRAGLTADPERRPGLKEFVSDVAGNVESAPGRFIHDEPRPARAGPLDRACAGSRPKPSGGPTTEPEPPQRPAPVDLRLIVSRQVSPHSFVPVAATHPQPRPGRVTRDMKKVPPSPDQVRLRTGDRVRIEVGSDRPGFLTVFNVGPTGTSEPALPRRRSPARQPAAADRAKPAAAHRRRRDDAAGRPRAAVRRLDPPAAPAPPRSVAQSGRTQARGFSRLPALRRDPRHEARPAVGAAVAARGLARRGAGAGTRVVTTQSETNTKMVDVADFIADHDALAVRRRRNCQG